MNLIKKFNVHGTSISLEDTIKKAIYDTLYPVGFVYMQLPDDPEPSELVDELGLDELGLDVVWKELNFGGCFFRTEGVNAMPYSPYSEGMAIKSYDKSNKQLKFNSGDYDFSHIGEIDYKQQTKIKLYNNIVIFNGEIRKITNKTTNDSETILTLDSDFSVNPPNGSIVLIGQSDTFQNHIHKVISVKEKASDTTGVAHTNNEGLGWGNHVVYPWYDTGVNTGERDFETRPESVTIKLWKRTN